MSKKLVAEFMGTFTLIFIGAGSIMNGKVDLLGVAFSHAAFTRASRHRFIRRRGEPARLARERLAADGARFLGRHVAVAADVCDWPCIAGLVSHSGALCASDGGLSCLAGRLIDGAARPGHDGFDDDRRQACQPL